MSDASAAAAWGGGCSGRRVGFSGGVGLPHRVGIGIGRFVRVCECCASGTRTKKCPSNKAFLHFVRVWELIPRSSESGRDTSRRAYTRKDGIRGRRRRFHSHTHTTLQMCLCRSDFFVCVSEKLTGTFAQNSHTPMQDGSDFAETCSSNWGLGDIQCVAS
jgi:hypothetical protein